jgi:anaerobic selenocysteine-containing dehydrogenase
VLPADVPDEWRTLCRLAGVLGGAGPDVDPGVVDDLTLAALLGTHVAAPASPVHGREVDELVKALGDDRHGPDRLLDALLRLGPYGEGFGARPDGLTLDVVAAAAHGLDLGPLQPRLPEVLRTPSGRVDLAPAPILADVERLRADLEQASAPDRERSLVLVGRRHLRSNNSWGHNVPGLRGGTNTCTLQIHPDDAAARGLGDGALARVASRVGAVDVAVEVTDRIRPGVVSLPHGWGHAGGGQTVAAAEPGVNVNVLTPPDVDPLSGTAVLNGFEVSVAAVAVTPS